MIPVLEGKEPIMVTAVREREIRDAIAFGDKQKVKIILCDAPEAYKVTKGDQGAQHSRDSGSYSVSCR